MQISETNYFSKYDKSKVAVLSFEKKRVKVINEVKTFFPF